MKPKKFILLSNRLRDFNILIHGIISDFAYSRYSKDVC